MKRVYQNRTGKDGNCWSACLASIFELPIESVDQCACNHPDWWEQTLRFLKQYGFFSLEISFERNPDGSNRRWPFVAPPDGTMCVVKGQSINDLPHVVIAETKVTEEGHLDFILIHDPLNVGEGVLKTVEVIIFMGAFLTKLSKPPIRIEQLEKQRKNGGV